MQKISILGSVASIVALLIIFFPVQSQSGNQVSTYGSQSPAIGENKGNININYNNASPSQAKGYVLRNAKGGSVLVVKVPSIKAAVNQSEHICMAVAGTPIILLGQTEKMAGIDMWQSVKITAGPCANKIGWVAIENISYE